MSKSKEEQFWDAARAGDLSVVKNLAADPTLNINWQEPQYGFTSFNIACYEDRVSVVHFLLILTTVDVNKPMNNGSTPFYMACQKGHKVVVSLLLADMRIDLNKPNNQGTPLFVASHEGHLPVVHLILASGREVDTKTKSIAGTETWNNKTAAEMARFQGTRAKLEAQSDEEYTRGKIK